MMFVKESSPHIRRKDSLARMMGDVLIALLPTLIFAFVVYPASTAITLLLSSVIMILCEFVFIGVTHMMPKDGAKHTFKEKFEYAYKDRYSICNVLTPLVSAVIFTLIMPHGSVFLANGTVSVFPVIVGSFVGIVLGKLVFGGTGSNIFNPAVVGMVVAKLCFGQTYGPSISWFFTVPDVAMGATPLGALANGYIHIYDYSLLDMFIGKIPGTLGEAFTITILIGLVYLLIRHTIDWRITASYLLTFTFLMAIAGACIQSIVPNVMWYDFVAFSLLSGGVMFGSVFMFTDPVTGPINKPGRVLFGIIGAVVTVFIRLFAALPEGVAFSILICNMLAPVIDFNKWSSPKYSLKNVSWMVGVIVVALIIMILGVLYGGKIA